MFSLFFLFLISTSRHNTTNFLSLTQQQQHFPLTHSATAAAAIYPRAPAAAAAIALKFHPKRYKQKQNETHYDTLTLSMTKLEQVNKIVIVE